MYMLPRDGVVAMCCMMLVFPAAMFMHHGRIMVLMTYTYSEYVYIGCGRHDGRLLDECLWDGCLFDGCLLGEFPLDECLLDECPLGECLFDECLLDECMLDECLLDECLLDACLLDECLLDACGPPWHPLTTRL